MFAWASGSDGSPVDIAQIGFSNPGRRQLRRIERAVEACLADVEQLVAFLPGPGHLIDNEVVGRRVSDAVVVTSVRLLLLGARDGDLVLLDDVPLADVDVLTYGFSSRRRRVIDQLDLRVRSQRMRVRVHPRYAGRTEEAGRAMEAARAQAHREAVEPPSPVEAAIRGQDFHLIVRIEDHQFPWTEADADDTDANWLLATVWVRLPGGQEHRMECDPCLETFDLERFVDELTVLVYERSGTAALAGIEPEVKLTIRLSDGKGMISGWVTELKFHDIPTDLIHVQEALEQFTGLAAAFPIKGPDSERPQRTSRA